MEKCSHSGNEGLLLLASLVSIQIAHQVTNDQLTLLSLFSPFWGTAWDYWRWPIPSPPMAAAHKKTLRKYSFRSVFLCYAYVLWRYSSMAFAAFLPAPIARMTVAAPVTASPPA